MKNHELYPHYLSYIEHRKSLKRYSYGAAEMIKISESAFNEFVEMYENISTFKDQIDRIHISDIRSEKLDDLFS